MFVAISQTLTVNRHVSVHVTLMLANCVLQFSTTFRIFYDDSDTNRMCHYMPSTLVGVDHRPGKVT